MVVPRTTRLQFVVVRLDFWLSVQYTVSLTKASFGYSFMGYMVVRRTTASVFLVVLRRFWLYRAHGQPEFRTLVMTNSYYIELSIMTVLLCITHLSEYNILQWCMLYEPQDLTKVLLVLSGLYF